MRSTKLGAVVTALCGLLVASRARAAELVEVLPLTDQILMVHFDDGRVTIAKPGEKAQAGDIVTVSPLDAARASSADAYQLTSADDSAYATAARPTAVGRKSKGTEFANHCDTWSGKCVNTSPDRAHEHWIYLVLPSALKRGKTYRVETGALASNASTTTFTFDETRLRSEAIHVNTVAYAAQSPAKYGYVYHWLGDRGGLDVGPLVGRACHLVRTSDRTVAFSSTLKARKGADNVETAYPTDTPGANFLGTAVADCDFSAFGAPGEYVLSVDGVGSSFPFRIDEDAFRKPFYAAMKGLFIQRSGIAIDAAHGEGYSRPAPHHPKLTPGFAGKLKYTSTRWFDVTSGDAAEADKPTWEAGIKGDLDTWGWYQDAGDWDAYFVHTTIPSQLLLLFEAHPDHFVDGELKIPESGNGIPDVIDEARWLIRFYHRTRHAILAAGYGTGGVGGARVMGDLWGSDLPDGVVAGSWQDTKRQWIVSGEDPWMTYRYAALAAHLAYVLKSIGKADPEGIDWRAEAEAAWKWASENTRAGDGTKHGYALVQMRMHAAVALYRLTGESAHHEAFKTDFAAAGAAYDESSRYWQWLYARLPASAVDASIREKSFAAMEARAAEELASTHTDRATRVGGNFYMPMFLGQGSTPLINDGLLALDALSERPSERREKMRATAYTTADYFLGTNPLNMTWISRLGPRYPKGPFHLDGFTKGAEFPPMGIIPYGPVAVARDWMAQPPQGPWSSNWPNSDVHPAIESWPGHERWFDQRTGIASCEFTVHQTTIVSAVVYGSLLEKPREVPVTPGADGGVPSGDGGIAPQTSDAEGDSCDCRVPSGAARGAAAAWALSLIGLAALRRRRRRH